MASFRAWWGVYGVILSSMIIRKSIKKETDFILSNIHKGKWFVVLYLLFFAITIGMVVLSSPARKAAMVSLNILDEEDTEEPSHSAALGVLLLVVFLVPIMGITAISYGLESINTRDEMKKMRRQWLEQNDPDFQFRRIGEIYRTYPQLLSKEGVIQIPGVT